MQNYYREQKLSPADFEKSFSEKVLHFAYYFVKTVCVTCVLIGSIVFILWSFYGFIGKPIPSWIPMRQITSLGFLLSGISLSLLHSPTTLRSTLSGRVIALVVVFLGLISFIDNIKDLPFLDEGSSYLLNADRGQDIHHPPTTILASFNFILLGISLFLLNTTNRFVFITVQLLIFISATSSLTIIYGYAFDFFTKFQDIVIYIPTSYAINVLNCFLALGLYFARPKEGFASLLTNNTLGGITARKLFFLPISIPFLIGFIRYTEENSYHVAPELIYGVGVFINMLILTLLLIWWVNQLWKVDLQRRKTLEAEIRLTQKLDKINHDLEDFAFVISHDLKAPLRGVNSLATWIFNDYKDKFDDEGKKKLNLLISRTQSMNDLITNILEYSSDKHKKENLVQIDLKGFIAKIIQTLHVPDNVTIEVDNNLPTIYSPAIQLQEVIQNILGNAIKFMNKPNGIIKVHSIDQGDYWQFCIEDNGYGIDENFLKELNRIFQSFTPLKSAKSTNIGLSIVKKNVDLWGGRVWVESKLGEKTSFNFTLPKTKF